MPEGRVRVFVLWCARSTQSVSSFPCAVCATARMVWQHTNKKTAIDEEPLHLTKNPVITLFGVFEMYSSRTSSIFIARPFRQEEELGERTWLLIGINKNGQHTWLYLVVSWFPNIRRRTDGLYDLYDLCDLYDRFPLHGLDISGQMCSRSVWCKLSWSWVGVVYSLRNLGHVSWVRCVLYTDYRQHVLTAG